RVSLGRNDLLIRTFLSTPLSKPDKFHSDALNMGFSLQWRY
ncbi:hypothetical protein, partial [Klebsiella pneumoniae]